MKYAFSLIELSIVLVILGLLAGGILAGQSLIRAAELRSYASDIRRYNSSYITFRDKYMAIPGDMRNATSFWGVLAGTGSDSTCQDTAATGSATCNGSGDGIIDTSAVMYDERFRFFQHLANAGLIEGSYTGKTTGASGSFTLSVTSNVPQLKGNLTVTPVAIAATPGAVGSFSFSTMPIGNYLELRDSSGSCCMMRPDEAWAMDSKLDDGLPAYGAVAGPQSSWTASPNCTSSDTPSTATYAIATNSKICRLNIRL